MKDALTQVLHNLKCGKGPQCPAFLQRRRPGADNQPRCFSPSREWENGWCRQMFSDLYDRGDTVACPCIRIRDQQVVIDRLEEILVDMPTDMR